jgi:hypothetical protein
MTKISTKIAEVMAFSPDMILSAESTVSIADLDLLCRLFVQNRKLLVKVNSMSPGRSFFKEIDCRDRKPSKASVISVAVNFDIFQRFNLPYVPFEKG